MIFGAIDQTLFLDWSSLLSSNVIPKPRYATSVRPQGAISIASSSAFSPQEQRKHLVVLTVSPLSPPVFPVHLSSLSGLPCPTLITCQDPPEEQSGLFPYWGCCSRTPGTFPSALSPLAEPEWRWERPELQASLHPPRGWAAEWGENPALTAALWWAMFAVTSGANVIKDLLNLFQTLF